MSLVAFKARNHPQQQAKASVDDRMVPDEWFAELDARFRFTVDAAATAQNARCARYFTRETDGLEQSWEGERVWCNPPYSNIRPWVEKAIQRRAEIAVLLLPANRTEQAWWQDVIEPSRLDGRARVEFLRHRRRFVVPPDETIQPNQRPPFGLCLVILEKADV